MDGEVALSMSCFLWLYNREQMLVFDGTNESEAIKYQFLIGPARFHWKHFDDSKPESRF